MARHTGATKADLEAFVQQAKVIADSVKSSMSAQNETTKKNLTEAVTKLEVTQKHAADGLKASGSAFQISVRQAVADARASVQKPLPQSVRLQVPKKTS